MLHQVSEVATAVAAAATVALVLGVFVAFLQLRATHKAQQLSELNSVYERYSSRQMLRHIRTYVSWALEQGEKAPFEYCRLEAIGDASFEELHNHRRQMSHSLLRIANGAELEAYSYSLALSVATTSADDIKFLLGVEWRLARQIEQRSRRPAWILYRRWPLVELFIMSCVDRDPTRYRQFLPKRWPTPAGLCQRRQETSYTDRVLLPRYRAFLTELSRDPDYDVWANAALKAVDTPL
jgi:hypothetical protein